VKKRSRPEKPASGQSPDNHATPTPTPSIDIGKLWDELRPRTELLIIVNIVVFLGLLVGAAQVFGPGWFRGVAEDSFRKLDQRMEAADAELTRLRTSRTTTPQIGIVTDFGSGAYYLGSMRGRILSSFPHAGIIDVSNEIRSFDEIEASWVLMNAAQFFPEGSLFICIVNPGADLSRARLLVTKKKRFYFLGASEKVFSHVRAKWGEAQTNGEPDYFVVPIQDPTDTFGTRTFADAAVEIIRALDAARSADPKAGVESIDLVRTKSIGARTRLPDLPSWCSDAVRNQSKVTGHVCAIDRWGNIQTDLPATALPLNSDGKRFSVHVAKEPVIATLVHDYGKGIGLGYILVAQDGWIQLARDQQNTAKMMGIKQTGGTITIEISRRE